MNTTNPVQTSSTYPSSGTATQTAGRATGSATALDTQAQFQELLTLMLQNFKANLSNMATSSSLSSNSSDLGLFGSAANTASTSSLSDLMMPLLMFSLLEKLLDRQVQPTSTTVQTGTQTSDATDPAVSAAEAAATATTTAQTPATLQASAANLAARSYAAAQSGTYSPLVQTTGSETSESSGDHSVPSGKPVDYVVITQYSNGRHVAIDYGVDVGTPAHATLDGEVVWAGWNNEGYGNLVIIQNGPYQVYYGHLSQIPVTVGQKVSYGDVIGLTGNTGNSTGPHLHYEVKLNGVAVNPQSYSSLA